MNNSAQNLNVNTASSSGGSALETVKSALLKAKNIVTDPLGSWPALKSESGTERDFFKNYLLILAAVGPVCSVIGAGILGDAGFLASLSFNIVMFLSNLLSVYAMSFVIAALAPKFGGKADRACALRFLGYSLAAAYLAGFLHLIPSALFGVLAGLLSLYSLYLFYSGINPMLEVPESRRVGFMAASIVACMVVGFCVGLLTSTLLVGPAAMTAPSTAAGDLDLQKFTEGLKKIQESMPQQ